jgi:peptidoglycan/xylan/chitin deacetylase (PgdA/CDA1 family)
MKTKDRKKRTLVLIISTIIFLILVFLAYTLFWPSSQILGKTLYTYEANNNGFQQIIVLTFDDGPGAETDQILDVLQEHNVKATFFVVCNRFDSESIGQVSDKNTELLKRISAEGHSIGLHGNNHDIFESYTELKACKETLENITGQEIKYYRPPWGIKVPSKMKTATELNLKVVTWSLFPRDYSADSKEIIIKRIERNLKNKDIVCLHDGPEYRQNTLEALPEIINYAKTKGYLFVKLD